jgi:segregation and condensation protein B
MDVSEAEATMERHEQRAIVEALILASAEPLATTKIAAIVPECSSSLARELVDELNASYEADGRGFEIREVGGGWQLRTRPEFALFVQELQPKRAQRLSRAALETLSVIAYRQPITRAEIEHVRGVDVGAVARSLLERDLVRIAGHREIPGRPMLYATTKRFLQLFGMASLEDLPTLRDLRELTPASAVGAAGAEAEVGVGESPADDVSGADEAAAFVDVEDDGFVGDDDVSDDDVSGDDVSGDDVSGDDEMDDAFDTPLAVGPESTLGDDSADDPVRKTH